MCTRRRSSLAPLSGDEIERLITKREMKEHPEKFVTCPPVVRKSVIQLTDSLRKRAFNKGKVCANIVKFTKETSLSNLYDPEKPITYLCQIFQLRECIGEGSFGIVYKAFSYHDGENYAIKLMKKYRCEAQSYDEVKRLEKIGDHENLVKFHYAWEERSVLFIQLELCALSLGLYTRTNNVLPLLQLWDILFDMLNALKHLHERELIHLDIKPDNIMMTADRRYKLGDFGLLVDMRERRGPDGRVAGVTSEGDAKYLAREVLEGHYTCAADIFSLGITILELAGGIVLPVNGPMWHVLRDESTSPYFDLIPYQLRTTVIKMMNSDFNARPTVDDIFLFPNVKRALKRRQRRLGEMQM